MVDINYDVLFEMICNSTNKAQMVDAFADFGIVNHTQRTGDTVRSADQYITFKDNLGRSTHLQIQKTQMKLFTFEEIADDPYFSSYEFSEYRSDGSRTRKAVIGLDVNEFRYIIEFFLKFGENRMQ